MKQIYTKFKPLILVLLVIAMGVVLSRTPEPKRLPVVDQPVVAAIAVPPLNIPVPRINLSSALAGSKADVKAIRVPILMYHHVGPLLNPSATDLTVSPTDFEAQVQYFKNLGYQSVTLQQVYDALENKAILSSKPIVFTFDDGYKDVFENAIPILQKYNYSGTFAIATDLLGRPSYAVWDDVIAAQKAGMEIVSHTQNHLDLTNPIYSAADLYREIFDSKILLEQKLGIPVDFFVYPYGRSNQKVVDLVQQAGYKMAFTTAYGQEMRANALLNEPRVRVHGQDGLAKLKKIFEKQPKVNGAVIEQTSGD